MPCPDCNTTTTTTPSTETCLYCTTSTDIDSLITSFANLAMHPAPPTPDSLASQISSLGLAPAPGRTPSPQQPPPTREMTARDIAYVDNLLTTVQEKMIAEVWERLERRREHIRTLGRQGLLSAEQAEKLLAKLTKGETEFVEEFRWRASVDWQELREDLWRAILRIQDKEGGRRS
ncbi:hypothetical protein BJX61DRAFT_538633 [Aspergillus egyptiacus]|nr:hypothetical protein BJX61DRAFT_538633 [Aspergillus egyptiacus]